jgi:hypothetical protein
MKYSIWELLCFIMGITVCTVILVYVLGAIILKGQATNPDNLQLRLQMIDLLKFMAGAVIGIASTKVVGSNPYRKNEDEKKE